MKKRNPLLAGICRMLLLSAWLPAACTCGNEPLPVAPPEIRLTGQPRLIPSEGGEGSFAVTVDQPVEGGFPAVSCADEWLRDLTCTPAGEVRFTVQPNENEALRTTTVTVSYPGAANLPVELMQEGASGVRFEVTLQDITSTGATFRIAPSDPGFYFTWLVVERDLFASKYASDTGRLLEEQTGELLTSFEELRSRDPYASLTDLLERGELTRRDNGFRPETDYLVFVYGVDTQTGTALQPASEAGFTTKAFRITDACTFQLSFSNVRQTDMDITIRPSDNMTGYYYGLCDAEELHESSPDAVALAMIRQAEVAGIDWSHKEVLTTGPLTVNTATDLEILDLEAGTAYCLVVFGVSDLGERTTAVAYAEQRMAEIPVSKMTFDIALLEQYTTGVKLRITPSVDDETYIAGCVQTKDYEAFVSDEAFMQRIVGDGNFVLLEGEQTLDRAQSLLTGKDYLCFAFGYTGGVTTPLTTFAFKTGTVVTDGTARVEIERIEIRDGNTAGYGDKALVYAHFTCSEQTVHWYARWAKSTDGVLDYDVTDQDLVNWLSLGGDNAENYVDRIDPGTVLDWGRETYICAMAVDAQGKFGPLMKYRIVADRSAVTQ